MKQRVREFKQTLEKNEILDKFERGVFESIIEKVIIGEYNEDGINDPAKITFVYKTGFKNTLNSDEFKIPRKNAKGRKKQEKLCLEDTNNDEKLCSHSNSNTCGDCC